MANKRQLDGKARRSLFLVLVSALVAVVLVYATHFVAMPRRHSESLQEKGQEAIAVYSVLGKDPQFLEEVPFGMLQPNGSAPIHWAHVAGLAHAGVYIAVRDSVGKLLMLQRSTHVKTCNGSWGFLGEHCHVGESQRSSVQRALDEEMGTQLRLMHVERLLNISTVWYNQVYDDGRRERQATHVWLVQLLHKARDVVLHPDDEVAALKWVHEKEVLQMVRAEQWQSGDTGGGSRGGSASGGSGVNQNQFCSPTIRKLMEWMLMHTPPLKLSSSTASLSSSPSSS